MPSSIASLRATLKAALKAALKGLRTAVYDRVASWLVTRK